MIKQKFIVKRKYWKVYAYYNVDNTDTYEILNCIKENKFPQDYLHKCFQIVSNNEKNSGITYSINYTKTSVIVITKTTNAGQFINTLVHEIAHLVNHISKVYNVDRDSEEYCYLHGDIAQQMFHRCHSLACECCRDD